MDINGVMAALHNPVSDPQRSGKDLSHRKVFSMKVGELLPVLCEEIVPKDYFEIDIASLVRSLQPLNTAAFLRAKLHFDFFFVPMDSIWRNFDAFYYQREDNFTSYKNGSAYEPNVTLKALSKYVTDYQVPSGTIVDSPAARAKMLQLLGYGKIYEDYSKFANGGDYATIAYNTVTALPLYAYNRIYNLHYRDAWRDIPQSNDIAAMSADNVPCGTFPTSLVSLDGNDGIPNMASPTTVLSLVHMHYHKYPMDLFMGLLPSQQFGSVSTIDVNASISLAGLSTGSSLDRYSNTSSAPANLAVQMNNANSNLTNSNGQGAYVHDHALSGQAAVSTSFDVITLRRAIAVQKWKEYNARAGWKAGKQAKAMFGVNTPLDRKHDIEFLDSYQFPIMVDEVVAQSTEGSSSSRPNGTLGELGGKVIGVGNGHTIKFSAGERHGYLMCIAYVLPQVEYNARGIDKMLIRSTPENHYMPAYQNLGLEAVYRYELNAEGGSTFNSTLGFVERYHEYKTRVDKVFADFMSNGSLDAWVIARRDLENAATMGSIPTTLLYVRPSIMDSVFAVAASTATNTDHFMVNANFRVKAVRAMSDLGLPTM